MKVLTDNDFAAKPCTSYLLSVLFASVSSMLCTTKYQHSEQLDLPSHPSKAKPYRSTDFYEPRMFALLQKVEEWEKERTWADNVEYDWEQSEAKVKASKLIAKITAESVSMWSHRKYNL